MKCIYTLLSITDDRVYSKKKTIVNTDKRKEICSCKSKSLSVIINNIFV